MGTQLPQILLQSYGPMALERCDILPKPWTYLCGKRWSVLLLERIPDSAQKSDR